MCAAPHRALSRLHCKDVAPIRDEKPRQLRRLRRLSQRLQDDGGSVGVGTNKPGSPAGKLLELVDRKGLDVLT